MKKYIALFLVGFLTMLCIDFGYHTTQAIKTQSNIIQQIISALQQKQPVKASLKEEKK